MAVLLTLPPQSQRSKELSPPIPDSNGNKELDGKDILNKLQQERRQLEAGAILLDAHAIMRTIDTNGLAAELATTIRNKPCTTQDLQEIAAKMKERLEQQMEIHGNTPNSVIREDAEAEVIAEATAKEAAGKGRTSRKDLEFALHQVLKPIDFAHSFKGTFREIKIAPEEVYPILVLFADRPEALSTCAPGTNAPSR